MLLWRVQIAGSQPHEGLVRNAGVQGMVVEKLPLVYIRRHDISFLPCMEFSAGTRRRWPYETTWRTSIARLHINRGFRMTLRHLRSMMSFFSTSWRFFTRVEGNLPWLRLGHRNGRAGIVPPFRCSFARRKIALEWSRILKACDSLLGDGPLNCPHSCECIVLGFRRSCRSSVMLWRMGTRTVERVDNAITS